MLFCVSSTSSETKRSCRRLLLPFLASTALQLTMDLMVAFPIDLPAACTRKGENKNRPEFWSRSQFQLIMSFGFQVSYDQR